jgi:hypothetical protein
MGLPEENMMSQRSKRELLEEIRPRYLKAKKTEKTNMLDEFVAACKKRSMSHSENGVSRTPKTEHAAQGERGEKALGNPPS